MKKSFHSIRKQYTSGVLDESGVSSDPHVQLSSWLEAALDAGCAEPTAMVLSTVGAGNIPSSRVVLMKELDGQGIVFFTNYESRKGRELELNPNAALLFFWPQLERQVRLEGRVERIPEAESDAYFESRPAASRISAAISPQSREIPGRFWLEEKSAVFSQPGSSLPERPHNWGGYRLRPHYFEFWQGRADRLHDRICYRKDGEGWGRARLAP